MSNTTPVLYVPMALDHEIEEAVREVPEVDLDISAECSKCHKTGKGASQNVEMVLSKYPGSLYEWICRTCVVRVPSEVLIDNEDLDRIDDDEEELQTVVMMIIVHGAKINKDVAQDNATLRKIIEKFLVNMKDFLEGDSSGDQFVVIDMLLNRKRYVDAINYISRSFDSIREEYIGS